MDKPKANSQQKKRRVTSANRANARKLPDTHWAHAVSMLAETIKTAELESKKDLSEDFPDTAEFEIIRVRALSSQI